MLHYEDAKALILDANPGDELELHCDGSVITRLRDEIPGFSWKQITIGHFLITVPERIMKRGRTFAFEAMDKYRGGLIRLDMNDNSARVYVSQYNKAHGTQFKVTIKDGLPYLYADVKARRYITLEDYQKAVDKAVNELNELRKMVRPDSFFEMDSEEYDNGIDEVSASDLDGSVSNPEYTVTQYIADEEQFMDEEIEDDFEAVNEAKSCQICGEEFLTDDVERQLCDTCRFTG